MGPKESQDKSDERYELELGASVWLLKLFCDKIVTQSQPQPSSESEEKVRRLVNALPIR